MGGVLTDPAFWRDKRVLISGHTGFKGSWLSLWLHSMGADLRGVALTPPTSPSLFEVACIADLMDHNIADVRDFEKTSSLIMEFQPEIIFHMAAQPLVRSSYEQPVDTYSTNVMGTVHILEAARKSGSVRAIVNVTTDKCYENKEWLWAYRENEPMGGHDPYSSSKGCAELISAAYRNSFMQREGIALATARAGNVIGGGDWALDRLIPDILRALDEGEPVSIRNPHAIRPWQHVLEPLSGYLLLAQRLYSGDPDFAEGWNFGPKEEDARPVQWIVEHLCAEWNEEASWELQHGSHPHEASFLKLDISKARHRLGWGPRWSLSTALSCIVEWHKSWRAGSDVRAVCLDQISRYQSELNIP